MRERDLERPGERRLAQGRAQRPQIQVARLERALEACGAELAAAFEHTVAREHDAQLLEGRCFQIFAGEARFDARDRQPPLIERSRRSVGQRKRALQAAIAAGRLDGQAERRLRQLVAEAREVDGRGAGVERHEVLRPKGCQHGARVRGDVALASREPRLEALERAPQGDSAAQRVALVLELETTLRRYARRQRAERKMGEAQLAQAVHGLAAQHAHALDLDLAEAQAERQRRRARRPLAALADLDLERGDVQRLDHEAAAERGGEMRVGAERARLDAGAVGLETQPIDRHQAGQRAAGAADCELAARLALRALERPLQPALGGEEPGDGAEQADEQRGGHCTRTEEDGAQPQKPYPTEKCRRQSLCSAP